jgi:hypothetical protein
MTLDEANCVSAVDVASRMRVRESPTEIRARNSVDLAVVPKTAPDGKVQTGPRVGGLND